MKIGFCFAGQGSQAKGMGLDLYNEFETAKNIYDQFPEIRDLCFYDENNVINETKYAQKAMLLTSYVIAKILEENGIKPEYSCGLSLGEYSALVSAGTWDIKEAIDIISYRGDLMQNALPLGTSKMAAVIGLDRQIILDTIKNIEGVCEIANYNCPGQIVITGDSAAIDKAVEILPAAGAKRVIPLNVSGAFHSSLLTDASHKLRAKLDEYSPKAPNTKIIYNVSGHEEAKNINEILEAQICHSVYFEDSIKYMLANGVDTFIEVGPGTALSGFIKRTDRSVKIYNTSTLDALKDVLGALNGNN